MAYLVTSPRCAWLQCLSARLSMVNKKLKPKVWGDPPSYRETINPIKVQPTLGDKLGAGSLELTCLLACVDELRARSAG